MSTSASLQQSALAAEGGDFQRATCTKRLKSNEGGSILKKSSSISDLAGLTLTKSASASKLPQTVEPSDRPVTPKVQFNEAELIKLVQERNVDKLSKPLFKKGLKRSAQSCPDLASLDDTTLSDSLDEIFVEDAKNAPASSKSRRKVMPPIPVDHIPAFDSKKLNRIISCPEFLDVYENLHTDDERKGRRLARNRASARLRRQRKRLMTDILEVNVKKLEKQIETIKSMNVAAEKLNPMKMSNLGVDMNHPDFQDTQRRETVVYDILKNLRANIDCLCADAFRLAVLGWVGGNPEVCRSSWQAFDHDRVQYREIEELRKELISVLELSPGQVEQLGNLEKEHGGAHEFSFAVFLKQSLFMCSEQRLHQHPLLDSIMSDFINLCQDGQKKKFLTWSAKNVIAINSLNFCDNNPPKNQSRALLTLQSNCSLLDGSKFNNLPSAEYFPSSSPQLGVDQSAPVFFFGGRDSMY